MGRRSRHLLICAIALAALVLAGTASQSQQGDEHSARMNRTEHPGGTFGRPAPRAPENRLRAEGFTRFMPGAAHNESGAKNNIGDEIRRIIKHSRGQIDGGFGLIVYNAGPGDAFPFSSKVYGVGQTNAMGDEGIEGFRSEVTSAGEVPRLRVAEPDGAQRKAYHPNEKGSHWIAVRAESSSAWRFMGEDALVVLTNDPAAARFETRGFDRQGSKDWLPLPGKAFPVPGSPHPRRAFALVASSYPDLNGKDALDWLAVTELEPARLRTSWLYQGDQRFVPPYYTPEGSGVYELSSARRKDRRAILAPAYTLRDLRYAVDARNAPVGLDGLIELAEPLGAALAPGTPLEVHSGGPPHAIYGGLAVVKPMRGGMAFGQVVSVKNARHPLTAVFAGHAALPLPQEGVAAEYGLDVDQARHAVRHRYRGPQNGAALSLAAMQGWGERTYPVIAFENRGGKGQVSYDSKRGEWLFDGETLDQMIDRKLDERRKR